MRDKLDVLKENICKIEVDAILCQANTELEMEDEVTKCLFKAGGDTIQSECNRLDNLSKGTAAITTGGELPCKYLIHAIVHAEGDDAEEEHVMSAIRDALLLAKERGLKKLSIPLIGESAGIPIRRAAELILTEVKKHFDTESCIEKILLIARDEDTFNAFDEAVRQL